MIIVCYGTRPEIIKLSSVIKELSHRGIPYKTVFTGQHKELFEDVKSLVPEPDYNLAIMSESQQLSDILTRISTHFSDILQKENASLVIVQGDTSTTLTCALLAFYNRVGVGHVEAGLRTYNLSSPYPEEGNRQMVSRIAKYNWAPTKLAAENLMSENVQNIIITGNTVVDVCKQLDFPVSYNNQVLITLHRRENFGEKMENIFHQLEYLAVAHPELQFIFPMHPNPNVQQLKPLLKHVDVVEPMEYLPFIKLLAEVKFVISDSGGLQEECATFRKKILVCRDTTERPESIQSGFAKLVDDKVSEYFDWANDEPGWEGENPFGDGTASVKIVNSILE